MKRTKVCSLELNLNSADAIPVVYQKSRDLSKVALICGGGSGHEPAHAGYVGKRLIYVPSSQDQT